MLVLKNNNNISIEIIAHRGASYSAPENTLAAINRAWELKADGVEIPVILIDYLLDLGNYGNKAHWQNLAIFCQQLDEYAKKKNKFMDQSIL